MSRYRAVLAPKTRANTFAIRPTNFGSSASAETGRSLRNVRITPKGKRGDRVQFVELFNAASRREFDAVLFWSLDRFTREGTLPTLQYLRRLESYSVAYRSFTESWLDSLGHFKDVVLALLASVPSLK